MAQVLLHINDVELVLSRLFDVLNEGGHLLIVDFNKNEKKVSDIVHNGFNQAKLTDIMTKIGYRDIQSKTFYNGSKISWVMMHLCLALMKIQLPLEGSILFK